MGINNFFYIKLVMFMYDTNLKNDYCKRCYKRDVRCTKKAWGVGGKLKIASGRQSKLLRINREWPAGNASLAIKASHVAIEHIVVLSK